MAILEHAVSGPATGTVSASVRAAKLFPKGTPGPADFIRAMRDGRYGEEWAESGWHGTRQKRICVTSGTSHEPA